MTSLQNFFWQLLTISEHSKEIFSWGLYLLKSEILDSKAVALERMEQFRKYFWEFTKFKNIISFLDTSRVYL